MNEATASEVAARADFSLLRYGQCWEDAEILVEGLAIQPGDTCLSIASAGDNSLALLTRNPRKVVALDLNPAQLAALELRVAAFRCLEHAELLELLGSRPSDRRTRLYRRCRAILPPASRAFWDARPQLVEGGIAAGGKFENYFALFRRRVLPLVHSRRTVNELLRDRGPEERTAFYRDHWNTWRWRLLFRLFFSRWVMGRMGRDREFFRYVEGGVAERILRRTEHALTVLNPAENPYLHWILRGRHGDALPFALRPENFDTIRHNIDRIEGRLQSVEAFADEAGDRAVDRFNLSDIFEYMSGDNYRRLLDRLVRLGRPGGRLAYWNMLAPRSRPDSFADRLLPLAEEAAALHRRDRAFFYSAFILEEITG